MTDERGAFALVLHSHLPWLAHHGVWPVGEEWLYQAWASSYLPVLDVLDRMASEGRRDLVTLGVTPVLAAQLDDPHCVQAMSTWVGFWQKRSEELAASSDADHRSIAEYEFRQAQAAMEAHQKRGALSPSLRRLSDAGAVEIIGGPATHPFQPLYPDEVVAAGLRIGSDDAAVRWGSRPEGIWAPECGYRPGLEEVYADAGVRRFMVDGPTFQHVGAEPWSGRRVGDTDVVAFARDLSVTYRVWSPKRGYPSHPHYRDFHTMLPGTGFRPSRVTGLQTPSENKRPYRPHETPPVVARDAADFVDVVVARLAEFEAGRGRPGLVVAAYDTELFGHWWHEGPQWLEAVLRLMPQAGIRVTTLRGAAAAGYVDGPLHMEAGSWGSGKDWRVWAGAKVADMAADNDRLVRRWRGLSTRQAPARARVSDQIAREALLALASDWAFMVTKDSAAQYARARHDHHHRLFHALADRWEAEDGPRSDVPADLASDLGRDDPFAHLDARTLW